MASGRPRRRPPTGRGPGAGRIRRPDLVRPGVRRLDRADRAGLARHEVKDVEQLVTWLARQPRVLLDHRGDPRVGITGASYGGGISHLPPPTTTGSTPSSPEHLNLATALSQRRWWRQQRRVQAAMGGPVLLGSVGFGATARATPGQAPGQARAADRARGTVGAEAAHRAAAAAGGRAGPPWRPLPPGSAPSTSRSPRPVPPRRPPRCCCIQPGQRGRPDARPTLSSREAITVRARPGGRQLAIRRNGPRWTWCGSRRP
jgi:ABC-2 type transport system ATP-binding protein